MQKLCNIIVLSGILFVGKNVGMEQQSKDLSLSYGVNKEIMSKLVEASYEGNAKKFIDDNPYITNAWVEPYLYYNESHPLLHCMVEKDKISVVQDLLQAGADIQINTATEWYRRTPLHMVRSKEMATLLLQYGAKLESKDKDGNTPLSRALFYRGWGYSGDHSNQYDAIKKYDLLSKYLLERGANSSAVDNNGDSLLHRAVNKRDFFCVPWLIKYGADIEFRDNSGKTFYDCVVYDAYPDAEVLQDLRQCNMLFIFRWDFFYRNHIDQFCRAFNIFELLKNGAAEFKSFVQKCTDKHIKSNVDNKIKDLLMMAQYYYDFHKPSEIINYDKGPCFKNVRFVDLEEWVGKDSIDYLRSHYGV